MLVIVLKVLIIRNSMVLQVWSYAVIAVGFSLFFTGLMGWVGGASESPCLVR
jgi:hypothetical protein